MNTKIEDRLLVIASLINCKNIVSNSDAIYRTSVSFELADYEGITVYIWHFPSSYGRDPSRIYCYIGTNQSGLDYALDNQIEIAISLTKNNDRIAKEIERRLITANHDALLSAVARIRAHNAYEAEKKHAETELLGIRGSHKSSFSSEIYIGGITVRPQSRSDSTVKIDYLHLNINQIKQLAELLTSFRGE